jgi:hypothetical protein
MPRGTKIPSDSSLKAAPRKFEVYIGGLHLATTAAEISNYIKNDLKINVIDCKDLNSTSAYFKSFKVTINYINKDTVLNPENWYQGIIVNKFFSPLKTSIE